MTSITRTASTSTKSYATWCPSNAEIAAAAFLARYSGRTLEAYRHEQRCRRSGRELHPS